MKKSKQKLVLATNNKHKVKEIKAILKKARLAVRVLTLNDFPKRRPVVEDKKTIEGNARKKAREVAQNTGCWALADDTGLFVNALRGRPGVYSARFAGSGCNYQDNCRKVLRLMKRVPWKKRGADFRTVAALAHPNGKTWITLGRVKGKITDAFQGNNGFGYDPVFYVPRLKKTYAEMSSKLKNKSSHRGKAFAKIPPLLKRALRGKKS